MSRPSAAQWAEAIGATLEADRTDLPSVAEHVRQAVVEHGLLTRARLLTALAEAYAPFDLDREEIKPLLDQALKVLAVVGELDVFFSAGGRAYAPTPPRVVRLGEEDGVLLGAAGPPRAEPATVARRGAWRVLTEETGVPVIPLSEELGDPAWRDDLVRLGGTDAPSAGPRTLLDRLLELARDGEPFEREGPERVRVLSGRGAYFGRVDAPQVEGRWAELEGDGVNLARRMVGYVWRDCVLATDDGQVRVFDAPGRDAWRWAAVALTQAAGDPVWREVDGAFELLVEAPAQVRRAADLCGERIGPWRWTLDDAGRQAVAAVLLTSDRRGQRP